MVEPIMQIAHLVQRIDTCDREARSLNFSHVRPVLAGASPVSATLLGGSLRLGRVPRSCASPCPFLGGLNRSTQHFIVGGKIDYRPISQRFRDGKKAAKKMSLWDSWLRWDSLEAIGRVFGKPSSLFIAA